MGFRLWSFILTREHRSQSSPHQNNRSINKLWRHSTSGSFVSVIGG
ncbi:hypothetical protein LINPERHAP1_LOCUS15462 [Linum perenne]